MLHAEELLLEGVVFTFDQLLLKLEAVDFLSLALSR